MKVSNFDIACDFYKSQVNKTFTPTYDQKISLSALFNQAKHGPFTPEKAPEIGMFDFVGKERRAKWQALGSMSASEAGETFVQKLLELCPQFAAHLEAIDAVPHSSDAVDEPLGGNIESTDVVYAVHRNPSPSDDLLSKPLPQDSLLDQESQIRCALNAQTLDQFKEYAAQCYPDNSDKQADLILQLQDRHYHQYMSYLAVNFTTPESNGTSSQPPHSPKMTDIKNGPEIVEPSILSPNNTDPNGLCSSNGIQNVAAEMTAPTALDGSEQVNQTPIPDASCQVAAPQMWTRKDITEFKSLLAKDPESVVNVGSGELVTIRVPMVSTGNCVVWEFATDDYDIGFGLFFEWASPSRTAFKSEDGPLEEAAPTSTPWNLIQGSSQPPTDSSNDVALEELIPIYRRTSNTEVFCGSHQYPSSEGTYLLKFDNTYSMWRSKVLYYRVYCTSS